MIWAAINIFFSWWAWKQSAGSFKENYNGIGWMWIFVSAMNFAAALVQIGF